MFTKMAYNHEPSYISRKAPTAQVVLPKPGEKSELECFVQLNDTEKKAEFRRVQKTPVIRGRRRESGERLTSYVEVCQEAATFVKRWS